MKTAWWKSVIFERIISRKYVTMWEETCSASGTGRISAFEAHPGDRDLSSREIECIICAFWHNTRPLYWRH